MRGFSGLRTARRCSHERTSSSWWVRRLTGFGVMPRDTSGARRLRLDTCVVEARAPLNPLDSPPSYMPDWRASYRHSPTITPRLEEVAHAPCPGIVPLSPARLLGSIVFRFSMEHTVGSDVRGLPSGRVSRCRDADRMGDVRWRHCVGAAASSRVPVVISLGAGP